MNLFKNCLIIGTIILFFRCSEDDIQVIYPEGGETDIEEEIILPHGCKDDSQCDDGLDCTQDKCNRSSGLCEHIPDDSKCSDGLICNGKEKCDEVRGCIPGDPYVLCNDNDSCTIDICIEPEQGQLIADCDHILLDRDQDHHLDIHCIAYNGDDCNDMDPSINPDSIEYCFDEKDNDCDGRIDMADTDCSIIPESCNDAKELLSGIVYEGYNFTASPDLSISCAPTGLPDTVYRFKLSSAQKVELRVWGQRDAPLFVAIMERGCPGGEIFCNSGENIRYLNNNLNEGEYYVVVKTESRYPFLIFLQKENGEEVEGDSCYFPQDISLNFEDTISLWKLSDMEELSCNIGAHLPDIVYRIELQEEASLRTEIIGYGDVVYAELVRGDCEFGERLFCGSGRSLIRNFGRLEQGVYFLKLEGSSNIYYRLKIDKGVPVASPTNDNCSSPSVLQLPASVRGSLLSSQGDYQFCILNINYDVVYQFSLTESSDIEVVLSGNDGLKPYFILTEDCSNVSLSKCYSVVTGHQRFYSLQPSDYFIIVGGEYQADFQLGVYSYPPSSLCDSLPIIASSVSITGDNIGRGDNFRGSCGGSLASDTAYKIELSQQGNLYVRVVNANFTPVIYLIRGDCIEGEELGCSRYLGVGSLPELELNNLQMGTYYLVVDGTNEYAQGNFTLELSLQ